MTDPSPSDRHLRRRPSGEPPPLPREIDRASIAWLAAFLLFAVIWVWVFLSDRPAIEITELDLDLMAPLADNRVAWLTPWMERVNGFGTHWLVPIVGWSTLLLTLVVRRIRHAVLLVVALSVTAAVVNLVAAQIYRPRPLGFEIIGDWEGFAQPSRPVALIAAVLLACSLSLVPKHRRLIAHAASAVVLVVFATAQVYTAVDHPTDVFAGATVGIALTLVLYRTVAPERVFPITYGGGKTAHLDVTGSRGDAIRLALRSQLDIEVDEITPIGLAGSAGSTPLLIETTDGEQRFAKLYARSHLRSDRSYKLWRTLAYGRLEDEQRFASVRRLVQHEDYMLHVMSRAGVPCAEPVCLVELTPDREYLLVTEFLDGATEITECEVDQSLIDQGLETVETMWRAGLAHRDIKPANLMVQRARLRIVDVAFAQIRPSPWRQAVDLANMMLVLALQTSPEVVLERARQRFSEDELAEAFAASRGITLPSELRRAIRRDGRELLERFRELVPERRPVSIQRWSLRRVALTAWVVFVAVVVVGLFLATVEEVGLR